MREATRREIVRARARFSAAIASARDEMTVVRADIARESARLAVDPDRASNDREFTAVARDGRLGPAMRDLQARIDSGDITWEDVVAGRVDPGATATAFAVLGRIRQGASAPADQTDEEYFDDPMGRGR